MTDHSQEPPIFVVGTPRSGTTLTAQILSRHPAVLIPGELHFFEDIYARRNEIGDLSDLPARERAIERLITVYGRYNQRLDQIRIDAMMSDPRFRAELLRHSTSYPALLSTFMSLQLQGTGKVRWGNNTPKDIFHAADILSFYPDARFLVCVRDIRDFMLSYKDRWRVSDHGERLQALYHPILTALLWRTTAKAISPLLERLGPTRCMIVRYESLVGDPERTVRSMTKVLGLSYSPDLLDVREHNSSGPAGNEGIFTSSVGRWRNGLTSEEVYVAERIAGAELTRLGYEPAVPPPSFDRLAAICASLPGSLLRALWANREHRGPTLPYLRRRLGSLLR